MKPGSTTTSRKPRTRARNGAIPPHQTEKIRTQPSAGNVVLTLLGWTTGNSGTLHVQVEHCDQCNVCRSPKEPPASCNKVRTMWTSEYTCFAPIWQCAAPYCPFYCCNNPKSVLRVSSTSAVPARPRHQWLSFMSLDRSKRRWEASLSGPTKRCSRRCTSGCVLSQKIFFYRYIHALPKRWNTCMERNGDYIGKWSNCVPFVFNKLRDKKFKVFIWLTLVFL